MRDLFPFKAPAGWTRIATKLADVLSLDTLPLHFHEILCAFALYHVVCSYISPAVTKWFIPQRYAKFDDRTKLNWHVHVVSFVQSVLISSLSLYVLWNDKERAAMDYRERVWGYTGGTGMIQSMGCGYFLWDFWISLENVSVFGPGLLAHASSAFWVYMMGFRPFTAPYAPNFLLYELSSPFLNIHWALDKLDMTGSDLQLVNGVFLMSSFFGSRLVWGVYQSYNVFSDVFRAIAYQGTAEGKAWLNAAAMTNNKYPITAPQQLGTMMRYANNKEVPYWLAMTYLTANAILTMLNIYWFGQMIKTIRGRFDPPFGTKNLSKNEEPVMGRGLDADGTKSVEVSSQNVRKRGKKGTIKDDALEQPAT